MQFQTIIETAIGVILVLAVVSVLTTAAVEVIAGMLGLRGKELFKAIERMIGSDLAGRMVDHPLLRSLTRREGARPSYLRSTMFARVLGDVLQGAKDDKPAIGAPDLKRIEDNTASARGMPEGVPEMLAEFLRRANGNLEEFQREVEEWYAAVMERVEGWYTRNTRRIAFFMALLIAGVMNVDVISLTTNLAVQPDIRGEFVGLAEAYEEGSLGTEDQERARELLQQAALSSPAIGWSPAVWQGLHQFEEEGDWIVAAGRWGLMILGWLLTALAATLGAPFWFDLLSRLMRVRATGGGSSREKKKDADEDRGAKR